MHVARQFVDGYAKYPIRFEFRDISSGSLVHVYDLRYNPGEVRAVGTLSNRGYWQPIEDYLGGYNTSEMYGSLQDVLGLVNSKFASLNIKVNTLDARISNMENALSSYAPKSGARFFNPKSAESPSATDSSNKIATTKFIRDFIAQYPFPPKNTRGLIVTPGELSLNIKWGDPDDFAYDGMELAKWAGTKIVYRTDRYPVGPDDGVLLVDNTWRDWYSEVGVAIESAGPQNIYYFQAFPYADNGLTNKNAGNRISARAESAIIELSDLTFYYGDRYGVMSSRLGNGAVLFSGGGQNDSYSEYINQEFSPYVDVYLMDGTKVTFPNLTVGRIEHAMAIDGVGNSLIGGGYVGENRTTNSVNRYTVDGVRRTLSNLTSPVLNVSASTNGYGETLFAGGYAYESERHVANVDLYDSSGSKSTLTPMMLGRSECGMVTDGNGDVWIVGGVRLEGGDAIPLDLSEKYTKDRVRVIATPISAPAYRIAGTKDANGNVVFFLGENEWGDSMGVNRFTPDGVRTSLKNLDGWYAYNVSGADVDYEGNVNFPTLLYDEGIDNWKGILERYAPSGEKLPNIPLKHFSFKGSGKCDGKGNYICAAGSDLTSNTSYKVQKRIINL